MFDPDRVGRLDCELGSHYYGEPLARMVEGSEYVKASDYDQLLALYRELEPLPPDPKTLPTIKEMRGLVPDFTGGLTVREFVDS